MNGSIASKFRLALLSSAAFALASCSTTGDQEAGGETAATSAPSTSITQPAEPKPTEAGGWDQMMRVADRTRDAGDLASAARLYSKAHSERPNDIRPLISLGDVLRSMGAYENAIRAYTRAMDLDPGNPVARRGLGYCLLGEEKPFEAADIFREVIADNPNDYRAMGGLGVALDSVGKHAEAQSTYRKGLQIDPNDLTLKNNLGLSLALSGDYDQSIALLEAVAADPRATAKHRQNLALAYGLSGRTGDASRVSSIDLDDKTVRNNMAYFKALHGDQETRDTPALAARPRSSRLSQNQSAGTTPVAPKASADALQARDEPADARTNTSAAKPARPAAAETPAASTTAKAMPAPEASDTSASPSKKVSQKETEKPATAAKAAQWQAASSATADNADMTPSSGKAEMASIGERAYFVQLGSYRSEEWARMAWRSLHKSNGDLLASHEPVIVSADLGEDKGVYYRLRVGGFEEKDRSDSLCDTLKGRGLDCFTTIGTMPAGMAPSTMTAEQPPTGLRSDARSAADSPAESKAAATERPASKTMGDTATASTASSDTASSDTASAKSTKAITIGGAVTQTETTAAVASAQTTTTSPARKPVSRRTADEAPEVVATASQATMAAKVADDGTTGADAGAPSELAAKTQDEMTDAASDIMPAAGPAPAEGHETPLYYVQLGAYRSEETSLAMWEKLQKKAKPLLDEYEPVVRAIDLGNEKGGMYYRLRIGSFTTGDAAETACANLKNRAVDCYEVKG